MITLQLSNSDWRKLRLVLNDANDNTLPQKDKEFFVRILNSNQN